jgi:hypothetical protein
MGYEMASTTDMNIILGQGSTIREVHNVRKQNLELNQQYIAQQSEEKKKEDRARVQEFDADNRIELEGDEEKKKKKGSKDGKKGSRKENGKEERLLSEGSLIDIKV